MFWYLFLKNHLSKHQSDTSLPFDMSDTLAEFQLPTVASSEENQRTDRQTDKFLYYR